MYFKPDIISESPDKKYRALFYYYDSIRFGPCSFKLKIDKIKRFFITADIDLCGESYVWSENSKYFAVQKWDMFGCIPEKVQTNLLVVNVIDELVWVDGNSKDGWVEPVQFEGEYICYNLSHFSFEGDTYNIVKNSDLFRLKLPHKSNENLWKKI